MNFLVYLSIELDEVHRQGLVKLGDELREDAVSLSSLLPILKKGEVRHLPVDIKVDSANRHNG